MSDVNLQNVLSAIDINADWVGLREVRETTTYRVIRDGNPQANSRNTDHGVMVEVLADGQFGYYGTHDISYEAIRAAVDKAYNQAIGASKYPVYSFTDEVRPKSVGNYNSPYKIKEIPLDDLKTFQQLSRGNAVGVFQLESNLGKSWAKRVKPKNIEELAALVSIIRPGTLKAIQDGKSMTQRFVDRKNLKEEITYLHPSLEPKGGFAPGKPD